MITALTLKRILKTVIVLLFLTERVWYYSEMKTGPSEIFNLHHEIIPKFDVDYKRVDAHYENHQFFILPLAKSFIEGIKSFVEHHTNLNQTVEHEQHSHLQNLLRTFKNKLIDLDIKFEFFFQTAYDLLMVTFLTLLMTTDSLICNWVVLGDTLLKVLTFFMVHFKDLKLPTTSTMLYTIIQDFLKRDFEDVWKVTSNFYDKQKLLFANIFMAGLLSLLFVYLLFQKFNAKYDLSGISQVATGAKKVFEETMHEVGVGISKGMEKIRSPRGHKDEKEHSPEERRENANLKTMESENANTDINSPPYQKINPDVKKKRQTTPSKRRQYVPTL